MPSRETLWWRHFTQSGIERQVRKQAKRKRKPDRVRNKDWMPEGLHGRSDLDEMDSLEWDEASGEQSERIMPRGERERRRETLSLAQQLLQQKGSSAAEDTPPTETAGDGQRGVVVEVSSALCRVDVQGRELLCALRGALSAHDTGVTNVVSVGDDVLVEPTSGTEGVVRAVLPRRSALARPDVFDAHLQQVIVANADQVLIVASWREPAIWLELIDRYLIAAERSNLAALICVNKIDLAEDAAQCRAELQPYVELGQRVLFTCAPQGVGIDALRGALQDHTTVLAGLSGVGKSSLLRAVQPGLELRTGDVSERHHAGKHTTTQVRMLRLEMGGYVVDTPGIREFGLSGLRKRDLAAYYPEIAALAFDCRFTDCTHGQEPGCAVRAAVGRGLLCAARYHSYGKIRADLPE